MFVTEHRKKLDLSLVLPIILLLVLGIFIQASLDYVNFVYFFFIAASVVLYLIFASIDFDILAVFSKYFYLFSVIFLLVPIFIGTATRGTVRWIPIGELTLQPAEIVRPFLLIFLAVYLNSGKKTTGRLLKGLLLYAFPTFLILIQPSLGVTIMTSIGAIGIFAASHYPRKYYAALVLSAILAVPLGWGVLADYQRERIATFLQPQGDPLGAGYNSLQAMISVGSGRLLGRGLGRGIQTQLAFLPERQSDFVFAAIGEELGFMGTIFLLIITFYLLWRLIIILERASGASRAYVTGLFLSIFAQIFVHVGMNIGILPITGVPYPLISAGGSSLIATMMGLGIASSIKTSERTQT